MINKVKEYIIKYNLLAEKDSVIIGVSGGADSVCLLSILYELSKSMDLKLTALHINHGIRGANAASDFNFVEELCKQLNIDFIGITVDVKKIAKEEKLSIEEAGRKVRYEAFANALEEKGANKITVAHNKNDNAETILLSLFRGTGIKGLTGIKPLRDKIVRPLLCVDRSEIEEYLRINNILYRTDESNADLIYMRNKIRLCVLPTIIDSINVQAVNHIINAGEQLGEIENYLDINTNIHYKEIVLNIDSGKEFNCEQFRKLDIVIQKRMIRKIIEEMIGKLKDITKVHINAVIELTEKEVGKQIILPYGLSAKRTYDTIVLKTEDQIQKRVEFNAIKIPREGTYSLPYNNWKISFTMEENLEIKENMYTKCFDYDKIKGDLFLRTRLEGDYLTIDSLGHTKKLKSFFIDSKVPKEERANILLLAKGSHILWVVGHRISETYKVTGETKKVLKVHLDGGHDGE